MGGRFEAHEGLVAGVRPGVRVPAMRQGGGGGLGGLGGSIEATRSTYSITSSARASSVGDTAKPRALAVLRLTTSAAHCGTTAFALSFEKSGGTSNLPVCRSYLQRQPCTTPVCMGLRVLMSASPERPMRRYRFSGQSTPSQR